MEEASIINHQVDPAFAILVSGSEGTWLDVDHLIVCYQTCRSWQAELDSKGYTHEVSLLCSTLGKGRTAPIDLLGRIRVCKEQRMGKMDQIRRFLVRHASIDGQLSTEEWLKLAASEPEEGFIQQGVTGMHGWAWKCRGELPTAHSVYRGIGYGESNDKAGLMVFSLSVGGGLLAGGCSNGSIRLWGLEGWGGRLRTVGCLEGGHGWTPVCGIAFETARSNQIKENGDRRLVSGGADGTICVWDGVDSLNPNFKRIMRDGEWVSCVSWGSEGLIAYGDLNGGIHVWDARPNHDIGEPLPLRAPNRGKRWRNKAVRAVTWDGNGLLASTGDEGIVRLWSVRYTGKERGVDYCHVGVLGAESVVGRITSLGFDGEGMLAGGGGDGRVRVWCLLGGGGCYDGEPRTDIKDGEPRTDIKDGEPRTDIKDGEPRTDIKDGEPRTDIKDQSALFGPGQLVGKFGSAVLCLSFLCPGVLITGGGDKDLRLSTLQGPGLASSGPPEGVGWWKGGVMEGHCDHVRSVLCVGGGVSPGTDINRRVGADGATEGMVVSGGEDGSVRVWDLSDLL